MKKGDLALIYHTGDERAAVGVAEVVSNPYPDPKEGDERLVVVDLKPKKKLPQPVTLSDIKADKTFEGWDLLRIGLLTNRSVLGANAYNLMLGAAVASALYFVTLYLQRVLGEGAAATGMMFLPFGLAVIAGSVLAAKLTHLLSSRALLISGGLLAATGFGWYALISPGGSYVADILGPEILVGAGYGLYTIGAVLAPALSTDDFMGTGRYLLGAFPVFAVVGGRATAGVARPST